MLLNKIESEISKELGFNKTHSQARLFSLLSEFTLLPKPKQVILVKGYAGTGKTSAISAYVRVLKSNGFKVVLLAPTGRAAKVFSNYAGQQAFTIHKKIYRQKTSKDGFGSFSLDRNLHTRTIFIVDEASMISNSSYEASSFGSGALLADLTEYVFNNKECNLVLIGDTAQLPPVGLSISPALDESQLKFLSNTVTQVSLEEVVRQESQSGILHNATFIREKIKEENYSLPLFDLQNFEDILPVEGSELIESISSSYDRVGVENTLIVCRSNKRANSYNQGIRSQILWREEELCPGDLLMVVKNNYFWLKDYGQADFIANGDIVELVRVQKYIDLYGFRFARCTVRLIDYDLEIETLLLLDSLHSEAAALSTDQNKQFFYSVMEDYADLKPKKKQYEQVRLNEYFNALQVKYANAITCHKSQGGQWEEVYIDAGYLKDDMIDKEYLRWLYTAVTRATKKLYLVGFKSEFLGNA